MLRRWGAGRSVPLALALALLLAPIGATCGDQTPVQNRDSAEQPPDSTVGSGGVNAAQHVGKDYVVMLSLDGFRHDYLDLFETPNLDRISGPGVRAEGLIPIFPVKTFPNHYSIATGMYSGTHGLVGNDFYDPLLDASYSIGDRESVEDGRFYGGEPIWVTAETQGMVTASFFWVGTEAPVNGVQPTHWRRFDGSIPYRDRVDQVISWLSRPPDTRPHMVTLYFEETDQVGHDYPTDSDEMREAVTLVDGLVGRLLDGIEALPHASQVHVIVVSDHGMAPFYADQTYFLADLVEIAPDVRMVGVGSHMVMYVPGSDAESDAEKDALRDELAQAMPRVTVYRVGRMPTRLGYAAAGPRLGDIVLVPDLGWNVVPWGAERGARDGWTHGWDPENESMHGLFVARGPRIVEGERIGSFESIHIYPLLAEILGLEPNAEIDGRMHVLAPILR